MNILIDRSRSNRIIVICAGKLDSTGSPQLEEAIHPLIEKNKLPIVLDLAGVNHISDIGVQTLQNIFKRANEVQGNDSTIQRGQLRISNMSSNVRDMLRMKGLLYSMTHHFSCHPPKATCESAYENLMTKIRDFFPSPVSDLMKDAYFTQSISKGLSQIDRLKTSRPYWGERQNLDYDASRSRIVPDSISTLEDTIEDLSNYMQGHLIWGHPKTQDNVIPPATIASITGQLFGAIANANVIWDAYSQRFAEAEVEVSGMCASLLGYDPIQAAGVFTFGGTATIFYGIKMGIEKALPGTFRDGIRQDVKLICSDAAHYAKLNALGWLGLGTKNLMTVPTDNDNSMNLTFRLFE
ncbi:MAG: STAS domain-containing protein [Desulfobacteraceae bacterium]|nr:STAS domain-containing protein [Desulfobacteraceae bacterium]